MSKEILFRSFEDSVPNCKVNWTRSAKDFKNEVNRNYKLLTKNEMIELVRKIQSEKNIRVRRRFEKEILDALGPLIMRLAMQYSSADNYMDYVQDACITVLNNCVYSFNTEHDSNSSFVTYCTRAIVSNFNVSADKYATISTGLKKSEIALVKRYIEDWTRVEKVEPDEDEIKRVCDEHDITYTKDILTGINFQSVDIMENSDGSNSYQIMHLDDLVNKRTENENLKPDFWTNDFDAVNTLRDIRNVFIQDQTDEINRVKEENIDKRTKYLNNIRDVDILFKYYGVSGFEKKSIFELSMEYGLGEPMIKLIIRRTPKMIMDIIKKHKTNI